MASGAGRAAVLPPGLAGELGDLFLGNGRWAELEQTTSRLETASREGDALALRACGCLARREFSQARQLLAQAIVRSPLALLPRVLLSHALLQEGTDRAAAERALRDVLTLAPDHTEAQHNLSILLQQLGSA